MLGSSLTQPPGFFRWSFSDPSLVHNSAQQKLFPGRPGAPQRAEPWRGFPRGPVCPVLPKGRTIKIVRRKPGVFLIAPLHYIPAECFIAGYSALPRTPPTPAGPHS